MTLGEKIAKLRTEHHQSQGDLAEKLGVSRQSISKWETGSSIPDLDKLVALSELFDVSLDTLVKDQDPKENTDPQPSAPHQSPEKYPPRKIAGWILMGIGLLSVVLGVALRCESSESRKVLKTQDFQVSFLCIPITHSTCVG